MMLTTKPNHQHYKSDDKHSIIIMEVGNVSSALAVSCTHWCM